MIIAFVSMKPRAQELKATSPCLKRKKKKRETKRMQYHVISLSLLSGPALIIWLGRGMLSRPRRSLDGSRAEVSRARHPAGSRAYAEPLK